MTYKDREPIGFRENDVLFRETKWNLAGRSEELTRSSNICAVIRASAY